MIRYPKDYNPIREYWEQIESEKIVVSNKIYKTFKKIISDLDNEGEYYYSNSRANHIIEFCENYCRHSKGKMAGKPVILELWEKAILATVFGFIDIEGNRKYERAILIVAKKNGKSLIASCVGLYMLCADGEGGPEIYAVATKKDQSKIIWLESKRMVRKSPSLLKRVKPLVAELNSDFNDGVFKPLASDSDTLDGLNVHCVLMDEFHQWKSGKALYDIMADGTIAREQPLIFMTSTAGTIREDIYDDIYYEVERIIDGYADKDGYRDEKTIAFVYELDKREEWTDEECWQKANPGLGTIKRTDKLKAKVEKAKANDKLVKNILCKEFNIRETDIDAWLNFDDANNESTYNIEDLKGSYAVGGVDLSATTDLTCATILLMKKDSPIKYVMQQYFIPENVLEKKIEEDKIPYDIWEKRKLVTLCEGNKVNYKDVTAWFMKMVNEYDIRPLWIGYDPWNSKYWVDEMKNIGFEMIEVRQGAKTFSQPMKEMEADFKSKIINYNNSPVLKWCLTNTVVKRDENDNIRPIKGKNQKARIDGAVSLLIAYTILFEHYNDYQAMI